MQRRGEQLPYLLYLHTGLLLGLTCCALSKRLSHLTMPFGQVPALITTNHNHLTMLVLNHATCGFNPCHLTGKNLKCGTRIRRQNNDGFVIIKKSDYLRSGNRIFALERNHKSIGIALRREAQLAHGKPYADRSIRFDGQ